MKRNRPLMHSTSTRMRDPEDEARPTPAVGTSHRHEQEPELRDSGPTAEGVALALRRGESAAVHAVRERVRRILAFRAFGFPADTREDLEQEVVTEVWRAVNRTGFDPSAGFWGFIETVTARRCIDWLRSRRNLEELPLAIEDTRPGPLGDALESERSKLAFQTLGQLDAPCRQLIYLQAGLGKSYGEIGEIVGKSEGALRIQMYRCVRAARAILDLLTTRARSAEQPRGGRS